jgi:hypothetical protein
MIVLDPWDGSLSEINATGPYKGTGYPEILIYSG